MTGKRSGNKSDGNADVLAAIAALRLEVASLAFVTKQARDEALNSRVGTDRILAEVRD